MPLLLRRIVSPSYPHYSYLLGEGSSALVIDPRRDVEVYLETAAAEQMQITGVLETHRHEDFVSGAVELGQRTGATIWRAAADSEGGYGQAIEDGQEWSLGGRALRAVRTPGYTPGSTCFLLEEDEGQPWLLFSGDTLFASEVGRTDLFGEENNDRFARELFSSLSKKVLPLPGHVILLPAHGAGSVCGAAIADRPLTTLAMERELNPKLSMQETEFVAALAPSPRPPYFERMHHLNTTGAPPSCSLQVAGALPPKVFEEMMGGAQVIDTRYTPSFATSHVPGALSLYPEGLFSFAGWFLDYGRPLLLVCDPPLLEMVVTRLRRLGFDHILGYLAGGMMAWHTRALASSRTPTLTVDEACDLLDSEPNAWLLDVRRPEELQQHGEIINAHNIPLPELPGRLQEVPSDHKIYIFCGSGVRSGIAASILGREGGYQTAVILGGFTGWRSTTCPFRPPPAGR